MVTSTSTFTAAPFTQPLQIGPSRLPGELVWGAAPSLGVVVFAHGSGSSRASPRSRHVASLLQELGLATLLFDLLTEAEAVDRRKVFDIELLAERVSEAIDWLRLNGPSGTERLGLFGVSTGAAAALTAAAWRPGCVDAIVSRGGRPDLAAAQLVRVQAPTLLIVGGEDRDVLPLNRAVLSLLTCEKRLEIVPGASHLFDEPGTLDAAAQLAGEWFVHHLTRESVR